MKSLYLSECTEYESGWGSRPDGTVLGKSLEEIQAHIKKGEECGNHEIFWRYTKPVEVFCTDEVYDDIVGKMTVEGIIWVNDDDLKKFNFLKKY